MTGETRRAGGTITRAPDDGEWVEHRGDTFRYPVHLTASGGRFTAVAATVLGVSATGVSEAEALAGVRSLLDDLVRVAKSSGRPVAKGEVPAPPGALARVVVVRLTDTPPPIG